MKKLKQNTTLKIFIGFIALFLIVTAVIMLNYKTENFSSISRGVIANPSYSDSQDQPLTVYVPDSQSFSALYYANGGNKTSEQSFFYSNFNLKLNIKSYNENEIDKKIFSNPKILKVINIVKLPVINNEFRKLNYQYIADICAKKNTFIVMHQTIDTNSPFNKNQFAIYGDPTNELIIKNLLSLNSNDIEKTKFLRPNSFSKLLTEIDEKKCDLAICTLSDKEFAQLTSAGKYYIINTNDIISNYGHYGVIVSETYRLYNDDKIINFCKAWFSYQKFIYEAANEAIQKHLEGYNPDKLTTKEELTTGLTTFDTNKKLFIPTDNKNNLVAIIYQLNKFNNPDNFTNPALVIHPDFIQQLANDQKLSVKNSIKLETFSDIDIKTKYLTVGRNMPITINTPKETYLQFDSSSRVIIDNLEEMRPFLDKLVFLAVKNSNDNNNWNKENFLRKKLLEDYKLNPAQIKFISNENYNKMFNQNITVTTDYQLVLIYPFLKQTNE